MRIKRELVVSAIFALISASCAPSAKQTLDTAVYNQKIATNPCSGSTACTMAFSEAKLKLTDTDQSAGTEFCEELLKRDDGDLATCEVDIRNEGFAKLIASCKQPLLQRLASISKARNVGLKLQAGFGSFDELKPIANIKKFKTEIQYRDTSRGYFAVTGDVKHGQVVLTFDDGPEPTNTLSVLNTLASFGAKAHFFEVGMRVQVSPRITQRIVAEGHTVGNHTWDHPNMRTLSFEDAVSQIKRTHSLLHSVLGAVDPFFRFPFGNNTKQLDNMLYENQMADFKWAIDSNDWRMTNPDKSVRINLQVINDVMTQLRSRGRGIILMHDIHRRTAELLPELLRQISEGGYTTVMLQPTDSSLKTNPPILSGDRLP